MKIKNLQITSASTLDLELNIEKPICVLHGEHSALVLDLIRELIGDYGAETDPDCFDDGHFVMHADVEIDKKSYGVCYIRNADFMGDNRIAANFAPNSLAFSEDDTVEFLEKCRARAKDTNNVLCNYKLCTATEDDRPLFVYCEDADDVTQVLDVLSSLGRQAFVAVDSQTLVINDQTAQTVFVG
ncbi:MAG: hypothetical protein IJW29_08350 [Clostridia bacterium]|nr:hypothetical protein [Clostridia bacterium]